jgi:hypothetical protein
MGALEVIVAGPRIGETSRMRRLVSLALPAFAVAATACAEGFEGTVWDDDAGKTTLSLFDDGAIWEERTIDTSTGEPIVVDGLRFEGVFTDGDEGFDLDVRCVSAKNALLATPCDAQVARKVSCTLAEDDDATLSCAVARKTIALHRRGVRRVTR